MRLEITVCYSILEYCFAANRDFITGDQRALMLWQELQRNRLSISIPLMEFYQKRFEEKHPELLQVYQYWMAANINDAERFNFVDNIYEENPTIKKWAMGDDYLNILLNTTYSTEDRIVLTEILNNMGFDAEPLGIHRMNSHLILDREANTYYNSYRFPILRKRIEAGESSFELSRWLSRIIRHERKFTIIDNYVWQNINSLKQYFLPHVRKGAKIKIYTYLEKKRDIEDCVREFQKQEYRKWDIRIFLVTDKRDQHARNILTENYFINLDKGLAIFGRDGRTDQSDINIDFIENVEDTALPEDVHKIL